jgi:hypothetical protein
MFCAPEHIFVGTDGVSSRFHVLSTRTCFRRCGGHWVLFSCFALPDSFSAVPRALGPVFMFCVLVLIFGGTEGVGSRFHVLCSRTIFRRYHGRRVPLHLLRSRTRFPRCRGRRVPFSCFARPDSFSAVTRASAPVFMFCDPEHVFDGTQGGRSRFYVLRARTRFRLYRGRQLKFSCFARPYSFSALPTASDPVFMFSLPDTFSALPKVLGLVFMFCAPGLIFDGTESVESRFYVLRPRTRFRRYRGRPVPFSCFRSRTRFRRCGRCWDSFSCFALPDSFSAVPRESSPVFMFCVLVLVFGGTDGVRSLFHVLRYRTCFRRYPRR